MKNYVDLIKHCESKLGGRYLYGYKEEIVSAAKNRSLAKQYPGTWTQAYLTKADSWIGQYARDCSGLISGFTGKLRGSYNYKDTATSSVPYVKNMDLSPYLGWAAWCPGHIGIVVGGNKIIEARSQAYGVVKTNASERNFTHIIKLCDIDYTRKEENPEQAVGWHSDENGWWYRHTKGSGPKTYYHDCIASVPTSKGVLLFAFDKNGYMVTSDMDAYKTGDMIGFNKEFGNIELGNIAITAKKGSTTGY